MTRRRSGILIATGLALTLLLLGMGAWIARPLQSTGQTVRESGLRTASSAATAAMNGSDTQSAARPSAVSAYSHAAEVAAARVLAPSARRVAQPVHTFDWQPHAGRTSAPPPVTEIFVDLPTLTVTADPSGALYAGPLAVTDLAALGITPDLVAGLTAADVQHIQIASGEAGLFVESNNQPILGLAWDRESVARLGQLLALTDAVSETWTKAMPLLTQINVDVVADLAQVTRRADREPVAVDPAIYQADPAALAEVAGREAAILELPIRYQPDGTPRILGLGALQLELLTGVSLSAAQLTPEQMAGLNAAGIQQIRLSTEPDGLYIFVNDEPLPTLLWAQGEVSNLAALVTVLADPGQGENGALVSVLTDTLDMVEQLVRLMQTVNVNVVFQFP